MVGQIFGSSVDFAIVILSQILDVEALLCICKVYNFDSIN